MSIAVMLQLLFGALAVLLVLESRSSRDVRADVVDVVDPPARRGEAVEFQPWRIVRWDDETVLGTSVTCRRSPIAARMTARHERTSSGRHAVDA